jgi:hypothetical protein
VSDQEPTQSEDKQDEKEMQDLDVSEEQQDDVMGGAMKKNRERRN